MKRTTIAVCSLVALGAGFGANALIPEGGDVTRDRPAAIEQRNPKGERELALQISEELARDEVLSSEAQNVTIMVRGRVVRFTGTVQNREEHDRVLRVAERLSPTSIVEDDLALVHD